MPTQIRDIATRFWNRVPFQDTIALCACIIAMKIQLDYRVPGHFLFLLLPAVGSALTVLNFVFLINHIVTRLPEDDPFRLALGRVKWWSNLLVRVFVYYSLALYANAKLDHSSPVSHHSQIMSISGEEIDWGGPIPYSWANLRSWEDSGLTERLLLNQRERQKLWGGEAVIVDTQPGYIGLPWVLKVGQDEEYYYRQTLKLAPTAAEVWKRLVIFYLKRERWEDASTAALDYLKIYPNDYAFAKGTAASFGQARRDTEALLLLEPFVARRKNKDYELYILVGWAHHNLGNNNRALELLEASVPLDPDNWWAYYHLGYVYSTLGRNGDAIAMFEKVLARRPKFPEIEQQLTVLRQKVATSQKAR